MDKSKTRITLKISVMAMLTGLSLVLVALISFPIFPAAPFLKYDPADIPILICTFIFGPWAGLTVTFIVSMVQSLILGDFPYGFLMHFIATGTMVVIAGLIYSHKKTFKNAVIGLGIGIVSWVIMMVIANLTITPFYTGAPREAILKMVLPIIVPFNLIKAITNSLITVLLYKRTHKLFNHILKLDDGAQPSQNDTSSVNIACNCDENIEKLEKDDATEKSNETKL
ncbi:MAG: ECF transporter S component [Clostridia bacterium]